MENPNFNVQSLGLNLGEAAPISAGDMDTDGDLDLIIGKSSGDVQIIENNGSRLFPSFRQPRALIGDGKALRMSGPVAPTLADLDGDGILDLISIDSTGQMSEFTVGTAEGKMSLQRSVAHRLPKLGANEQGYFVQFFDLDQDGDLDALVDNTRNRPGQLGNGYHYYVNYGTTESPYFVESFHSSVNVFLRDLDTQVTYGNRTLNSPYDQVQFYSFADWNRDGNPDLFQSDNRGEIHLRENDRLESVTIRAGQNSVTLPIQLIDDHQVEGTEVIHIHLIEGRADAADYHTEVGTDHITLEITDNDIADIQVLNANGEPIDLTHPVNVSETTGTATRYQVKLTSQPTSDVQLTIATSSILQGLISRDSEGTYLPTITLLIPSNQWDQPQVFWVKGVDNRIDDQDATFGYIITTQSTDYTYSNGLRVLQAISTDNDDQVGLNLTFDTLPDVAIAQGALHTTEGQINTVKVSLNSQPTEPVMVILDPTDREITFYPQRRMAESVEMDSLSRQFKTIRTRKAKNGNCNPGDGQLDGTIKVGQYGTLCWRANGDYTYTQTQLASEANARDEFSFSIDNGYGFLSNDGISIPVAYAVNEQETVPEESGSLNLITYTGNLFYNTNELAGQPIQLYFTPQDWNLERTVAVAAVDDDTVEYHHESQIKVRLWDPNQTLYGSYGSLKSTYDSEITTLTYTLPTELQLEAGKYTEPRIYFTQADDKTKNHTLDFQVTAINDEEGTVTYNVVAIIDQNLDQPIVLTQSESLPGVFIGQIELKVTGMSQEMLDPAYLATGEAELRVSIEDNDKPIVRAGVDLNAPENTHPGYFSLNVMEPVGDPSGLPVHYKIYAFEDGPNFGATAERIEHQGDPGPDFQLPETLKEGTLYIPSGQTKVLFPIFPIDDFVPEQSMAVRYETVIVEIQPPNDTDNYRLDEFYPDTQTAAVRILDNEEVGLKIVIPADGLKIDEGKFNGFRVGLKSQPQQDVAVKFYYNDILSDNQRDLTYLDIDSATFTPNNWNQWQTIDVRAFNNLKENRDDIHPRYTDLYVAVGEDNTDPFYNSLKGLLNLTAEVDNPEAVTIEGTVKIETTGDYGTLTTLNDQGDFSYDLKDEPAILAEIAQSPLGKVFDVFDYTIEKDGTTILDQKLAVEIRALNDTQIDHEPGF